MAERGGLPNLGPVALVVREQATLGAALESLSRYIHIHNEAMRLSIKRGDDVVILFPALRGERRRPPRQSTEWALGLVFRIIGSLFGSDWRPLEVHFAHSAPANRGYYRHFFGCDVIFDSDFDAILCAASNMDRPIPTANPLMARYAQSSVEAVDQRPENWDDKVSELVRALLPEGHCTIERVAEHFDCDRRTIHRHLLERGTSLFPDSGYATRQPDRAADRGQQPAAGGNSRTARLLGAKRDGALVSRTFRLQHHAVAPRHPAERIACRKPPRGREPTSRRPANQSGPLPEAGG